MRILELKIPPLAIVFLLGTAMWGTARSAPGWHVALPAGRIIAAGLASAGFAVAIMGVTAFRRAQTTVNPLQPGAASALVISGIYRVTRNPMYLGLLLLLLGWALFLANTLAFAFPVAYVPLMNRLQIRPEEKALAEKFGPAFRAYQSQVRRWL